MTTNGSADEKATKVVCGCDLLALKGDGPPVVVIGELKLTFNLELVLEGSATTVR